MSDITPSVDREPLGNFEPLVTPERVAELLALEGGVAAVYELRRAKNPLPAYRCGKYLRFRLSEITAWLESRRVTNERAPERTLRPVPGRSRARRAAAT